MLYTGVGGRESNAVTLNEIENNEESLAGEEPVYMYLPQSRVSQMTRLSDL